MNRYVAVLFPPARERAALDRLRRRYDPHHARVITAHVTLGDAPRGGLAAFVKRLRRLAAATRPFRVSLGTPRQWPEVIYLPVSPRAPLRKLREGLGLGMQFEPGTWIFHLTLVYKLDSRDMSQAFKALRGKQPIRGFVASSISVVKVRYRGDRIVGPAETIVEAPFRRATRLSSGQ